MSWGIYVTTNYLDDTEEQHDWASHSLSTALAELEEHIKEQTNVSSYLITITVPQRR